MEPTTEVFVCGPFGSRFSACVFPQGSSVRDVVERFVQQWAPASARDFYVTRDGGVTLPDECLRGGAVYRLAPRLLGGKGGFGSMLRALGAQIEKTTNREACRDLSGRRLRDVNHEKEMGEWLKQQADREADKEQRRAERLQRKMAEPKHQFSDPAYQRQCHSLAERLEDSVLKGLQAASGSAAAAASKRPGPARHQPPAKKKKKKTAGACSWTGLEDMSSEDEDDEDEPSRDDDAAAAQEAEPATGKGMPAPTSGEAHPEETASSGEERGVAAGRSPAPRRAEAVDEADGEGASASV